MSNLFFEKPILNSPYEIPTRHWELDPSGQPTQQVAQTRRRAEFITPIPKPRKQKGGASQGLTLQTVDQACSSRSPVAQVQQE
jgi:type III restriction enzyme